MSVIGVIGCGNMASAIVKGAHKIYPQEKFLTYTPSRTRAIELAKEVKGMALEDLAGLEQAESIIIGCKPQQFNELAQNLAGKFDLSSKHFISIMAAIPLKSIQEKLGAAQVSRVMPNTPALFNQGASLILHASEVSACQRELTHKIFGSCGSTHLMESEELFDQTTTVSGSGPAYVFLFAKGMVNQLVKWGVESSEARLIVNQLFVGSSHLMREKSQTSLDELISQVTSKGGVTIEAVKTYREGDLEQLTCAALKAAFKRSEELTEQFGKN